MKIPASAKYGIIEQMMQREDNMLNIKWLCETAGVSPFRILSLPADSRTQIATRTEGSGRLWTNTYRLQPQRLQQRCPRRIHAISPYGSACSYEHQEDQSIDEEIRPVLPGTKSQSIQKDRQSIQNRLRSRQPSESRVRGARPESHIADRHSIYHQWQGTALLYLNNNRCLHKGTAGLGIKWISWDRLCA